MRTASGLAMLVAMLVLLGIGGGALKLYMDRQSMADMIGDYGTTLAALPLSSPEAAQAFTSAAESARAGRYAEAQKQLEQGRAAASQAGPSAMPSLPGIPGMPGGGTPGVGPALSDAEVTEALRKLPDDARPFFEQRPELFRRALMVSAMARQTAPEKWDGYRQRIFKAAAGGDERQVESLLREARRDLGLGSQGPGGGQPGATGPGGMPMPSGGMPGVPGMPDVSGASPDQLAGIIAQSRQMLTGAKAAGLDTSQVEGLLNRAEAELKGGSPQKAAASLREMFGVVRQAMTGGGRPPGNMRTPRGGPGGMPGMGQFPRGGGGGRRPGGMGGGPPMMAGGPGMGMPPGIAGIPGMGMPPGMPQGMMGPGMPGGMGGMFPNVFGQLLGQLQQESGVLGGVMEDLENAGLAVREKNQDQIREILAGAYEKIAAIGKRRSELEKQLQSGQGAPQGPVPGGGWGRGGGQRPGWRGGGQGQGQGPGGPGQGPGMQWPGGQQPGGQGPAAQWPGGLDGFPLPSFGEGGAFDLRRIQDVLGRALDEIREMPQEEYEQQRDDFVQRLMGRMMTAVMGQEESTATTPTGERPEVTGGLPPLAVPAEEPSEPKARAGLESQVRERLRLLQEPYAVLAQVGANVAPVEAGIGVARDAVNGGRLLDAAKATNDVANMIWQLVDTHKAELEALKQEPAARAADS